MNFSWYGGGGPSSGGRPELKSLPGLKVLPPFFAATTGLIDRFGWPLNQNGWGGVLASSTPLIRLVGSGTISAGTSTPAFGNSTLWKPLIFHLTLSPLWIVVVLRKKLFASPNASWNCAAWEPGGPACTVFVAAEATAGTASSTTRAIAAPTTRPCITSPLVGSVRPTLRPLRGAMQPTAGRATRMETTTLGPLTVSRMCLGTMLMGSATPRDESHRMLDRFRAAGGTFVDTADTYSDGGSEETLAPWLARHRDEVVLATKVRFGTADPPGEGLAPERIAAACDASLRRLGIDVIDLYQVHAPDPSVPLEATLEALDALVRAGKVRALGASNFPAWLLAWAVAIQDREGWAPFVSLQPQYSLVERSVELELLPFCRAAGLGVLPWGPLGAGFLSGRYRRDEAPPEGSRIDDRGRTTGRRPGTGARPSRTSASSRPPRRSPPTAARRSRRSRSRG